MGCIKKKKTRARPFPWVFPFTLHFLDNLASAHTNFMHTENDLRPIVACESLTRKGYCARNKKLSDIFYSRK